VLPTLRPELLDGVQIALQDCVEVVREALVSLGATPVEPGGGVPDALVCGVSSLAALDAAWPVIQGVAAGSMIPADRLDGGATRKVLLIGPRPGGADAEPARAALENLARTLSIEWARYGIVAAMIAPGPQTSDEEVARLVAFLCSRAGHYYSGCRFSLGVVTDAAVSS
jgi:NAD(P)-dependent dehydrogenase (short-subunit alcohol dehydrogenase family)